MEIEIKLGFKDKESLNKVTKSDLFLKYCADPDSPKVMTLENSYRDDKNMSLLNKGASLRVRHYSTETDDGYEFTLKYGGGTSNGLHRRYEWNMDSSTLEFHIDEFKSHAVLKDQDPTGLLDKVFEDIEESDLYEICSNTFTRTLYELEYKNSRFEACFDSGTIKSTDGSITEDICELEVEITYGESEDLEELKALLLAEFDCRPLDKTKFGRTLALAKINREGT